MQKVLDTRDDIQIFLGIPGEAGLVLGGRLGVEVGDGAADLVPGGGDVQPSAGELVEAMQRVAGAHLDEMAADAELEQILRRVDSLNVKSSPTWPFRRSSSDVARPRRGRVTFADDPTGLLDGPVQDQSLEHAIRYGMKYLSRTIETFCSLKPTSRD